MFMYMFWIFLTLMDPNFILAYAIYATLNV